jgi:hypothetical protein
MMDNQRRHAALTNSMGVQHGDMDMEHGQVRTCSIGMQIGYAKLDMHDRHAAWTYSLEMQHEQAAWIYNIET